MTRATPDIVTRRVALVGAPNCGKTALFNRLTGSRQKVANYPGVTVERKEGAFVGARRDFLYRVIDLPGAYSLVPTTLDEAITRDVVTGRLRGETPPEMIICVLDATNLRLSLRLALELTRLSIPMIVALNMSGKSRTIQFDFETAGALGSKLTPLYSSPQFNTDRWGRIELAPFGAFVARLE